MVSLGDSTYWLWVIFSTNTLVSDRRSISPPLMVKNFRYALDFRWVLPVLLSLRSCACFRPMILTVETTYRVACMIVQTQHLPICVEDGQAKYLSYDAGDKVSPCPTSTGKGSTTIQRYLYHCMLYSMIMMFHNLQLTKKFDIDSLSAKSRTTIVVSQPRAHDNEECGILGKMHT
jgi:hypothetical protein